ncbi:MAG TPA: GDSL-type esterase/lipase family protein [Burkholderiales bacterium]|nr:GDSL-type esterase/lipase family protein [Burkholderiales bacterium]
MKRLTRRGAGIAALIALIAASAALTALYFHRARALYVEVQRVRLDPLGLDVYDGRRAVPPAAGPRVVLYGDSRVQQWVPPRIAGATILNRGVGGQTSAQALGRLRYDVLPLKPDVVVIQVGINDLKTVPLFPEHAHEIIARCKSQIREMAQTVERSGAQVVLTTVLPVARPSFGKEHESGQIQAAVESVNTFILSQRREGFEVLDVAAMVADERGNMASAFSKDELHLSRDGYAAINPALVRALRGPV